MSCLHGNHEDNCDNCNEEIRQWTMGYESQFKELCALKEEREALKKENAAFKAAHNTWVDAATDFRDAVLHGLDGLHSDQTNAVLNEFDQFLPIARPVKPTTDKLLQIIAATYQIAGACDMPVYILDVLANPERATQEQIDAMLPFVQTEQVAASAKGPSTLWLQLHGDCTDDETRQPVDYENDGVTWCWHAIHDSDVRYVRADLVRSEQPVAKHNFCPRCGKRLGGTDDIHTCTPPGVQS